MDFKNCLALNFCFKVFVYQYWKSAYPIKIVVVIVHFRMNSEQLNRTAKLRSFVLGKVFLKEEVSSLHDFLAIPFYIIRTRITG